MVDPEHKSLCTKTPCEKTAATNEVQAPVRAVKVLYDLAPPSSTFIFPPPTSLNTKPFAVSPSSHVILCLSAFAQAANLSRLTLDTNSSRNPSLNPQIGLSGPYLCFHLSLHPIGTTPPPLDGRDCSPLSPQLDRVPRK